MKLLQNPVTSFRMISSRKRPKPFRNAHAMYSATFKQLFKIRVQSEDTILGYDVGTIQSQKRSKGYDSN